MKITPEKFGAIPFWFWNGDQSKNEITRQLELAQAGGVRGMAIHARKGNQTKYMSERWINLFRHACLEARRLGLEIWLYDEEGCPSGTIGERLPARGEKYQQKALTFAYVTAEKARADSSLVRAFVADDLTAPINPAVLAPQTRVLAFSKYFITGYIDSLSRETLDEFLNMTHEIYWEQLREFFNDPVTAVYTDDLNHLLIYGEDIPYLSYTDSLESVFRQKYTYSILDNLPALVENLPGCEKIRVDYRHTIMRMFLDNYVEPMHQWCQQHSLPLTGHLSGDEGSMLQSICRFTSAMPFYEHEDIPGIDDFLACRQDNAYLRHSFNELGFSAIILCKQVSSVASQLKDGKCSSEVLTSRGWGIPVHQQMMQLRFQQGLGINILIPHDFSYSTAGTTKRDHPASYFFQQPWFCENREIQKALTHSSQLLSRGTCAAKIAILNPVTSGWVALDGERLADSFTCQYPGKFPDTQFLEKNFAELSLCLLQQHIDFEYVDEELLARHGKVSGKILNMGNKTYEILLLPPMINIQKTTLDLLKTFATGGGKIIQVGTSAALVNGQVLDEIFDFAITTIADVNNLDTKTCGMNPLLEFEETEEILLHTRQIEGRLEYFIVNFSEKAQNVKINYDMTAYVLYDPQTNRVITDNGRFPNNFLLQPSTCCHILPEYVILKAEQKNISESLFAPGLRESLRPVEFTPEIVIKADNDNTLLIDAGYLDNGDRVKFSASKNISAGTKITIPVNILQPEKVSHIYAEAPESLNMFVNGKKLNWASNSNHPATQDLHQASLQGVLHTGNNEIQIISSGERIEMFYLSGQFSVQLIDDEKSCHANITPLALKLGNAAQQGLPFYWGSLEYKLKFTLDDIPGTFWLDLGKVEGVVKLLVNGNDAGLCYKIPWLFNLNGPAATRQ